MKPGFVALLFCSEALIEKPDVMWWQTRPRHYFSTRDACVGDLVPSVIVLKSHGTFKG